MFKWLFCLAVACAVLFTPSTRARHLPALPVKLMLLRFDLNLKADTPGGRLIDVRLPGK